MHDFKRDYLYDGLLTACPWAPGFPSFPVCPIGPYLKES